MSEIRMWSFLSRHQQQSDANLAHKFAETRAAGWISRKVAVSCFRLRSE
jgi:hypothetical protein